MFRLIVALSVLCLVAANSSEYNDRIVNGRTTPIAEVSYQVSLQNNGNHFCGGSIIDEQWVLTAAHCVVDMQTYSGLTIVAGTSSRTSGGVRKQAELVIVHPEYNPKTMDLDLALIRVQGRLPASAVMKAAKICKTHPPPGSPVRTSGWGKTSEDNSAIPDKLQSVDLKYISNAECRSPKFRVGSAVLPSMICATGPLKDSCQGDSGGPLMSINQSCLLGVVSWGYGCARDGLPGCYADLTYSLASSFIGKYVGYI